MSKRVQQATLVVGERFAGRYEVEMLLGEGAMGVVARVRDAAVGEHVALKLLRCDFLRQGEAIARLQREVRLARRVTHRNVVRIHDIGEHRDNPFITMELVDGRGLDEWLTARERIDGDVVLDIVEQICAGLDAAHAAGVVHRDLKPSNVLVAGDGRVVLSDFGLARSLLGEGDGARTDGALGTPHYMAPEQLRADEVGPPADIYALGGVLFEMLTGRLPYEETTPLATAMARLTRSPTDPRRHTEMPDAVAELILQCLASDPADRPASAGEVAERMRACHESSTLPATAPTPALAIRDTEQSQPRAASRMPEPDERRTVFDPRSPRDAATRAQPHRRSAMGVRVAVLPLRARQGAELNAEAITEALVDVLGATRGVRVLGTAVTERYRRERDPGSVGSELDVDAVVDGRVDVSGRGRCRLSIRVLDVKSRTQMWNGRFALDPEDDEDVELLGWRAADALRLQIEILRSIGAGAASPATVPLERYLRGRREMDRHDYRHAAEHFAQCLEEAPNFSLALAGLAASTVQQWLLPGPADPSAVDIPGARAALDRALAHAPDLAETHVAASMLAGNDGRFEDLIDHLQAAHALAPAYSMALAYRALFECEAGRLDVGLARAERAHRLDPKQFQPLLILARTTAILGRFDEHARWLEAAKRAGHGEVAGMVTLRLRVAMWRHDTALVRQLADHVVPLLQREYSALLLMFCAVLRGDMPRAAVDGALGEAAARMPNRRFAQLVCEIVAELYCFLEAPERAIEVIEQLLDGPFLNVSWLDHSPGIAMVRDDARVRAVRRATQHRAAVFHWVSAD